MTGPTQRIDLIYFDAGSGHRSAALGLARALEARYPVRARVLDLLEVIRGHARFHRTVRRGIDYFNWWLRREQVWDLKGLINLSLLSHDLVGRRGVEAIARFWADDPPAGVVSVTPMYNGVLSRALRLARPGAPYLVVPVDFEEGKKRYWFEPRADLDYIPTTERLQEQALARGISPGRIHPASGMVIDPAFYADPPADPTAALEGLGLEPGRSTGVVSFGGQGSVLVERCVQALERVERPLNVIALCGRDERLRARIQASPTRHRRLVLGFAPAPPVLHHQLADFVVGKPGSMTITEAVVTRAPILAIRSRGMWVVQRGNERWIEASGAGAVVPRPEALPGAVERVLADPAMAGRLARLRHDGIFSAADRIAEVTRLAPAPAAAPGGRGVDGPSEG